MGAGCVGGEGAWGREGGVDSGGGVAAEAKDGDGARTRKREYRQ